ncbi:Disease resistance protein [Corchorus olitorius]|uniref:Disease resistance protein n=1 Tax=Corchorus olitorius TaxID=93759 RepID=A0A1R3JVW6_9ROSI|nr:Disease resistance protein [Corchorus olitorius]
MLVDMAVRAWLEQVDKVIDGEVEKVKNLEDKAESRCFIGLCPNLKSRYLLSKKAEEDASAFGQLIRQGAFNIVAYIDVPEPNVGVPSESFKAFDSRKFASRGIMEALKDGAIQIIGVYGMAGVGKSVLVKEAAREAHELKLFDRVVVVGVSPNPDIQKIQDDIAEVFGLELGEMSTAARSRRLYARFRHEKRILIVLDDIRMSLDLQELGISGDLKGCKTLLASRSADVLVAMDTDITFEIGSLTDAESWDLFKNMVGDRVETPELKYIAIKVIKKCAGLPLAIAAIAKALKDKHLLEWKTALQQLQRSETRDALYRGIKLSYDFLESEELKQIFLLCSLLGHDVYIECLLRYTMGLGIFHDVQKVEESRNRLLAVINKLKAASLLHDSYSNEHFNMIDAICHAALAIADNRVLVLKPADDFDHWPDEERMENLQSISLRFDTIRELPALLNCPQLNFLSMGSNRMGFSMNMQPDFFKGTPNLRVLNLANMHLSYLPPSIRLLEHLRTLSLDGCVLGDIAIVGELLNLEILSFLGSDIEVLPEEIGRLLKLKLLDLSYSRFKTISAGVLSRLIRLEELDMSERFDPWGAEDGSNATPAELMALSSLTALKVHIPDARSMPKDLAFPKLRRFKILIGEAWTWWSVDKNESSRTLKLELDTNTDHLDFLVKNLLTTTEALYLDCRKGGKIVSDELSINGGLLHLETLHIQKGLEVQYVINGNDIAVDDTVQFPLLQSLTLEDLPELISFCSETKRGFGTLYQLALFNEEVEFPCLENLVLSSINVERIWPKQLPNMADYTQNLKSLTIEYGDHSIKFPKLTLLEILYCPTLQGFVYKEEKEPSSDQRALFDEKVAFPSLERMNISNLRNLKMIWHNNQPSPADSFCKLKILEVEECDQLLTIFPSNLLGTCQGLQTLMVSYCANLEQVFELESLSIREKQVVATQLRELNVFNLPKLKYIWSKDPLGAFTFSNLYVVKVRLCDSLKNVFPATVARNLPQLEALKIIDSCEVEQIVSKVEGTATVPITFEFVRLSSLVLRDLPKLECFYPGKHTTSWPTLNKLKVHNCISLKEKLQGPSKIKELSLTRDEIALMMSQSQSTSMNLYNEIKVLKVVNYHDESAIFPFAFLQRFDKLEKLEVICGKFKELFPNEVQVADKETDAQTLQQIKFLKLSELHNLRHIWKQGSRTNQILPNLETLEVTNCGALISCGPALASFQSITTLEIQECQRMQNVFTSSTGQALAHLAVMRIRECSVLTEILSVEGEEATGGIIFRELKCLELDCLWSLTSFCSGNGTFKFPSLEQVIVRQCPRMEIFCSGAFSTPKLKSVQLSENDEMECWDGDLNSTIQQLYNKKVGYNGLEYLELARFPELMEDWSLSIQGIIDFKLLKTVEIYNCSSLRYIFSPSMVKDLVHLENLEICDCKILEEVAFPSLEKLAIMDMKNLKRISSDQISEDSFCRPKVLKLIGLPKQSTSLPPCTPHLISNLQELVVGKADNLRELFQCEGAPGEIKHGWAQARFSKLSLFKLPMLTHIWEEGFQQPGELFQNLITLKVSECSALKILVPSSVSFTNLTTLEIVECHGFLNLITPSTAKSMVQLQTLKISHCELITEIVAPSGEDGIISFLKLKYIGLQFLPSLTSFCSGPFTFDFPALDKLVVRDCPNLEKFSMPDDLKPQNLEKVCLSEEENWHWVRAHNLNTTIKDLHSAQKSSNHRVKELKIKQWSLSHFWDPFDE